MACAYAGARQYSIIRRALRQPWPQSRSQEEEKKYGDRAYILPVDVLPVFDQIYHQGQRAVLYGIKNDVKA